MLNSKHILVLFALVGLVAPLPAHAFLDLFRDTKKTKEMDSDPLRACRIEKKILPAEGDGVCVNEALPIPIPVPDRQVGLALADEYLAPQFSNYVGDFIMKAYSTSLLLDQSFINSTSCAATSDEAHDQLLTRIHTDLLAYGSTQESPDKLFECLGRLGLVDQARQLSDAVQFSRCRTGQKQARLQTGCPVAANPNLTDDPWLDPSMEFARLAKSLSDIDLGLKALDERNSQALADPENILGFAHGSCPDQRYFGGCTGFLKEYAACADPDLRYRGHCIPLAVGNGDRIELMQSYQKFWDDLHTRRQTLEKLRDSIIAEHPELVVLVTGVDREKRPVWKAMRDGAFSGCPTTSREASPECHRKFRDYMELSLRLLRGQNLLFLSHEICPDPAAFTRAALVNDLDIDRRFLRDPRFSSLKPLACYDVNEEYRGDEKKRVAVEALNKASTVIGVVAIIPTLGASTLEFVGAEGAAEVAGALITKTAAARLANMSLAGAALGISHEILGAMGVLRTEEQLYTNCLGSNQRKLAADRKVAAKTRLGLIAATVVLGVIGGAEVVGAVNDARKLALLAETLGAQGLAAESSAFTAIAAAADDIVGVFANNTGNDDDKPPTDSTDVSTAAPPLPQPQPKPQPKPKSKPHS